MAALFIVVALIIVYGAYRIHRHFSHAAAVPPTELWSQCDQSSFLVRIRSHPIIAFGDSITNGLGASRGRQDALVAGDAQEADTWRLEARHRFKKVESWTRAAANIVVEQPKETGGP
jgi:hypothetical protein